MCEQSVDGGELMQITKIRFSLLLEDPANPHRGFDTDVCQPLQITAFLSELCAFPVGAALVTPPHPLRKFFAAR